MPPAGRSVLTDGCKTIAFGFPALKIHISMDIERT
jgi:hypothetical protein